MELQSVNKPQGEPSPSIPRPQGDNASTEVAKEDLEANKKIERFDIPLDSLKMVFENCTEVGADRIAHSPTPRRSTAGPTSNTSLEQKRTSSNPSQGSSQAADSVSGSRRQKRSREDMSQSDNGEPAEAEAVSVKERMALYQAAVSKRDASGASSVVLGESEPCSLPGGLASVKKQFESQEIASSQSGTTQAQLQQRPAQVSHDQNFHQSNIAAHYENHDDETVRASEGEDLPKLSTRALKQQYEKTIEQASPSKPIKTDVDFSQFQWGQDVNLSSETSTERMYETSSIIREVEGRTSAYGSMENFPPPPSDLLQVPERPYSPEPVELNFKPIVTKEQYSKQRNLYEFKRLYKHINPEVRKSLESDFFNELESHGGTADDYQQARFMFENSGSSPSKCLSPEREYMEWDEILKGEVQSMRWIFENKPLDSIREYSPDNDNIKNIAQKEIIAGNDVKYTAWMFETQPMDALGTSSPDSAEYRGKITDWARGDVRTATWLFETQPLDTLNTIYQEEEPITTISTNDVIGGDVQYGRYLFENEHLDSLGHTETIDESHFLQLKSELEEIKGGVKKTTSMFETQPMCVIRGEAGEMLEITTVRREETERGDVKTSRWLFETQPLDMINQDPAQVKLVCGVSMENNYQGGLNKGRWLFEMKTLDSVQFEDGENSRLQTEEIIGSDVRKHCRMFEMQPLDALKDHSNDKPWYTDEIIGGDVQSTRQFFEGAPGEHFKDMSEVGKLQKAVALQEERGDVSHQKWLFESQPLENIREEKREIMRTVKLEENDKGDVSNCKEIFETTNLGRHDQIQKMEVEGITSGYVKANKVYFESTPIYAMQDNSGGYHEVKAVRREEIVQGNVQSFKWMFETCPIDQFYESMNKFQLIKGISKEEIESGNVKTTKWLFETQPLDSIKYFSIAKDEEVEDNNSENDIVKGDVNKCRWLFETQPMDVLYEKMEGKGERETENVQKGDVKTCTWLFETQDLDTIGDSSQSDIKTYTIKLDDVKGNDVQMTRFLFETENLENITGEEVAAFKKVTDIDIQSGDVSKMKYIFENQSSDIMTSSSKETMQKLKYITPEDLQKGNVINCTWLFENQPIDNIHGNSEEAKDTHTVNDVLGGDVNRSRFIFETLSLDKIQEDSSKSETTDIQSIHTEIEKGYVKNHTIMFETQPLYAIRDQEGNYHEVTTVTKEDVTKGDVLGTRWLFETKPLDSIKDTNEVYVIKAVTEENVQKGDVTSARWRFETQPLDEISEDAKVFVRTVDDIQGGDVRSSKQRFENSDTSQNFARMVSTSEIQKGDVKSAAWMFETNTIDEIHDKECREMERVGKDEMLKGDVKQSVWLFEKQPLDTLKDVDTTNAGMNLEEIPQGDVKTTMWLFETTPFHKFNENRAEKVEIVGKSVRETLEKLNCQKAASSHGIIIEADEVGDVRMAKFKLMNRDVPEIQKEKVIGVDLKNIVMNLLKHEEVSKSAVTINEEERGDIDTTVKRLFNQETRLNVSKEEIIRGDIQEAINSLLTKEGSERQGILIQEDEKGDIKMTMYSLLNNNRSTTVDKEHIVEGNVRGTLHRLLSNPDNPEQLVRIKVGETERGNVSFYSTCIESGALDYLKQLQAEPDEVPNGKEEKEQIVGGDVEEIKLVLRRSQLQIERTIAEDDIVPGDVHNTAQVFMTQPDTSSATVQKKEIEKGDVRSALDSLKQAMEQTVVIEKEELVKGDINTTLRSLKEFQNQQKVVERPEIVPGDIKGALRSLEESMSTNVDSVIEDLVPGDIKGAIKSLEMAKHAVKEIEKEEILKGDIQSAKHSLREASNERMVCQQQASEQGNVKDTIQLLLETATKQHKPIKDRYMKVSVKSLYDIQEQTKMEREDMIKGDAKSAVKSILKTEQHTIVKPVHAVKNLSLSVESHKNTKKLIKPVKSSFSTQMDHSHTTKSTVALGINRGSSQMKMTAKQTQEIGTVKQTSEQTAVTQNLEVKSLRTDLHKNSRKTENKAKPKLCLQLSASAPLSDPEFPPPPPECDSQVSAAPCLPLMRQDSDLPPPPPPPPPMEPLKFEADHFPPPPSPPPAAMTRYDYLPPPPSQGELAFMPVCDFPAKTRKITEEPMKASSMFKSARPDLPKSAGISLQNSMQELPCLPQKTFIPPVKLPTPDPEPQSTKQKPYMRKFKTPLMIAEEKYRKQKEETEKKTGVSSFILSSGINENSSGAFEGVIADNKNSKQLGEIMKSEGFLRNGEETVTKGTLDTASPDPSVQSTQPKIPLAKNPNSAVKQNPFESLKCDSYSKNKCVSASVLYQTIPTCPTRPETSSLKEQTASVSSVKFHSTPEALQPSNKMMMSTAVGKLASVLNTSSESVIVKENVVHSLKSITNEGRISIKAENDWPASHDLGQVLQQPQRNMIPKVTQNLKPKISLVSNVEEIEIQQQNKAKKRDQQSAVKRKSQATQEETIQSKKGDSLLAFDVHETSTVKTSSEQTNIESEQFAKGYHQTAVKGKSQVKHEETIQSKKGDSLLAHDVCETGIVKISSEQTNTESEQNTAKQRESERISTGNDSRAEIQKKKKHKSKKEKTTVREEKMTDCLKTLCETNAVKTSSEQTNTESEEVVSGDQQTKVRRKSQAKQEETNESKKGDSLLARDVHETGIVKTSSEQTNTESKQVVSGDQQTEVKGESQTKQEETNQSTKDDSLLACDVCETNTVKTSSEQTNTESEQVVSGDQQTAVKGKSQAKQEETNQSMKDDSLLACDVHETGVVKTNSEQTNTESEQVVSGDQQTEVKGESQTKQEETNQSTKDDSVLQCDVCETNAVKINSEQTNTECERVVSGDHQTAVKGESQTKQEETNQSTKDDSLLAHDVCETGIVKISSEQTNTESEQNTAKQRESERISTGNDSRAEIQKTKKHKSKKEKTTVREEKMTDCLKTVPDQEEIRVVQTHHTVQRMHTEVQQEVLITGNNLQPGFQQQGTVQLQNKVKSQKQKEKASKQQVKEQAGQGCCSIQVKTAGMSLQEESIISAASRGGIEIHGEIQKILLDIEDLQEASAKVDPKMVQELLAKFPECMLGSEKKRQFKEIAVENNMQNVKEIITYVRNLVEAKLTHSEETVAKIEQHTSKSITDKTISSEATSNGSKINTRSSNTEVQKNVTKEKKTSHDNRNTEESQVKPECRGRPSPLHSPSPANINTASTQITDTTQTLSSPVINKSPIPPSPSVDKCESPITQKNRATSTPTFDKFEDQSQMKDPTVNLTDGAPPLEEQKPAQILEKNSESVESPPSPHHYTEVKAIAAELSEMSESLLKLVSVNENQGLFGEGPRVEVKRNYSHEDSIHASYVEDLKLDGMDIEKEEVPWVDLSELVHRFETPGENVHIRKEAVVIVEGLESNTEDIITEEDKRILDVEEMPVVNITAIEGLFEITEETSCTNYEKTRVDKVDLNEAMKDSVMETQPSFLMEDRGLEDQAQPADFTETVREQFLSADDLGDDGFKSETVSQHSEGLPACYPLLSNANVVKRKTAVLEPSEGSSHENIVSTSTESEGIFEGVSCGVIQEITSQIVSHHSQEGTIVTGNLCCAA
ncbi:xin actin-binding repeat-containing protein 2-like isoform X2 [Brienomyrus brachyistius]|uniref:xin actin-binding repeat-containing protein 2-like isoform X2 n=1 Tax=Brienomyrus brachyistius TaxID=42636 RepID=UPI0020B337EA|nr:xin actin-binding repeat-containing protein 2-like isoform X2 [Brienomyrus brachyistius]